MDPEQRAKTPWVPGFLKPLERNMLDLDDPDHARLRALVSKAFTARLIERLRGRIEVLCAELLNAMERKGERRGQIELVADYALPLPATVIAELLGVPAEDHAKFLCRASTQANDDIVEVLALLTSTLTPTRLPGKVLPSHGRR